ncbi:TetR family transcriptional regulator [Saccharospirillum mangrovi]|uniref:TetR family transcriptional regulator n=1 Tax=Saccharospirillum mangrovi TaxID=2161747 RepID=UPI000D3B0D60|nr:TetR family transcriptional regulator [Saccharospirillum mangrovi]
MTKNSKSLVSQRKTPKQARANALIDAVLEAAIQVLAQEGAARFTTARVAQRAGVSVGSLYQYFPNKAAILFRLQSDEWRRTTDMCAEILGNTEQPPLERLRTLVHQFIQSECDEADIRGALNDAAPLYRDAPEVQEVMAESELLMARFFKEVLPKATRQKRDTVSELILDTLTEAGKSFSETPRTAKEIKTYAEHMADMFCIYLESVGG